MILTDREGNVLEALGRKATGSCIRCGECCRVNRPMCPHFLDEKPLPRCNLEGAMKPWSCKLYPLPDSQDVPAGCGIRFKER